MPGPVFGQRHGGGFYPEAMSYHDSDSEWRSAVPWPTVLLFSALLAAPLWALWRISAYLNGALLTGVWMVVSAITYLLYWRDKRKAQTGGWRTPETTLHTVEFFGGWPAALLAQRTLDHKVRKRSYQTVFWIIVAVHQYIALDYLMNWKLARTALQFVTG
jgi:uncharacterized membrane protein YsdA (DUF1294 family)